MYSFFKIKKYKYLGFSKNPLKGRPCLKACLKRPIYSLLESKPKNLKNPILKFEYISEII